MLCWCCTCISFVMLHVPALQPKSIIISIYHTKHFKTLMLALRVSDYLRLISSCWTCVLSKCNPPDYCICHRLLSVIISVSGNQDVDLFYGLPFIWYVRSCGGGIIGKSLCINYRPTCILLSMSDKPFVSTIFETKYSCRSCCNCWMSMGTWHIPFSPPPPPFPPPNPHSRKWI